MVSIHRACLMSAQWLTGSWHNNQGHQGNRCRRHRSAGLSRNLPNRKHGGMDDAIHFFKEARWLWSKPSVVHVGSRRGISMYFLNNLAREVVPSLPAKRRAMLDNRSVSLVAERPSDYELVRMILRCPPLASTPRTRNIRTSKGGRRVFL